MATFSLTIECDNAAFRDDDDPDNRDATGQEVARILANLAKYLRPFQSDGGALYDANGNTVGRWTYEP